MSRLLGPLSETISSVSDRACALARELLPRPDQRDLRAIAPLAMQALHGPYLDTLCAKQLAIVSGDSLRLTKRGKMLADKIAADLFATK